MTALIDEPQAGSRSYPANQDAAGQIQWPALIEKIQTNHEAGMEELYRVFSRGVRFFLWRQLGPQDVEDTVHDTFLIVAQAIVRDEIREPERLMGFIWTVVRRQVASRIERSVQQRQRHDDIETAVPPDRGPDPEWTAIVSQRQVFARRLLSEVSTRDREILVRFYLNEQTQEQICQEMQLSETQFRLLKSRAKARLEKLGRRKLVRRRICW